MQLFEWKDGGLKPSRLSERACEKLKSLSSVKRCSSEHLLPLNQKTSLYLVTREKHYLMASSLSNTKSNKESGTEAGFREDCTLCRAKDPHQLKPLLLKKKNIKTCNLISHKQKLIDGKLSDYWAQELIGSDLLKEELKKNPHPEIPNWIAIFDSPERQHDIKVKNLISDEGPHAVLPELGDEKIPLFDIFTRNIEGKRTIEDYKKAKGYKSALSVFKTRFPGDYTSKAYHLRKRQPHFINNSVGWLDSEDIYEVFKKLSPSSIVVTGSGNDFPERIGNMKSKASKNFDAIIVGSFSPSGFVSDFSVSGKEVHIMAPSDNWISSADKDGKYKKFRGTSGATPLVTGSLAGFEWLSGYHPTSKQAKILLEKTSLPTLHSHEKPQLNGKGLVNAYRLEEVGKR